MCVVQLLCVDDDESKNENSHNKSPLWLKWREICVFSQLQLCCASSLRLLEPLFWGKRRKKSEDNVEIFNEFFKRREEEKRNSADVGGESEQGE